MEQSQYNEKRSMTLHSDETDRNKMNEERTELDYGTARRRNTRVDLFGECAASLVATAAPRENIEDIEAGTGTVAPELEQRGAPLGAAAWKRAEDPEGGQEPLSDAANSPMIGGAPREEFFSPLGRREEFFSPNPTARVRDESESATTEGYATPQTTPPAATLLSSTPFAGITQVKRPATEISGSSTSDTVLIFSTEDAERGLETANRTPDRTTNKTKKPKKAKDAPQSPDEPQGDVILAGALEIVDGIIEQVAGAGVARLNEQNRTPDRTVTTGDALNHEDSPVLVMRKKRAALNRTVLSESQSSIEVQLDVPMTGAAMTGEISRHNQPTSNPGPSRSAMGPASSPERVTEEGREGTSKQRYALRIIEAVAKIEQARRKSSNLQGPISKTIKDAVHEVVELAIDWLSVDGEIDENQAEEFRACAQPKPERTRRNKGRRRRSGSGSSADLYLPSKRLPPQAPRTRQRRMTGRPTPNTQQKSPPVLTNRTPVVELERLNMDALEMQPANQHIYKQSFQLAKQRYREEQGRLEIRQTPNRNGRRNEVTKSGGLPTVNRFDPIALEGPESADGELAPPQPVNTPRTMDDGEEIGSEHIRLWKQYSLQNSRPGRYAEQDRRQQQPQRQRNRQSKPKPEGRREYATRGPEARIKAPRTQAIRIRQTEDGLSYADALRKLRNEVNLQEMGVDSVKFRVATTGGRILEISGEDRKLKADRFADRMRECWAAVSKSTDPVERSHLSCLV